MVTKKVSIISIHEERWADFIETNEEAAIFHHPYWLLNLCESYHYSPFIVAVINGDDSISAGVPFAEISSPLTGRRWVSLPYSDYCYPLFQDHDDLEMVTDFLLELHHSSEAPKIQLRWEYPDRRGIQRDVENVLHTKRLPLHADDYFNDLPKKVRKFIRSSNRRGVTIRYGKSMDFIKAFYGLQTITRKKHGVPVQPWRYFKLLKKNLLEQGLGFITLAFSKEGICIAGQVVLHTNKTLTIKYGASIKKYENELRANDLLMWDSFLWGINSGYVTMDMGRTDQTNIGLRNYKNKWGFEEQPLVYSTIGYPPASSRGADPIRFFQPIIRHSPKIVCRVAGELLYRHFS